MKNNEIVNKASKNNSSRSGSVMMTLLSVILVSIIVTSSYLYLAIHSARLVEHQIDKHVARIHTDNALKFLRDQVAELMRENGIGLAKAEYDAKLKALEPVPNVGTEWNPGGVGDYSLEVSVLAVEHGGTVSGKGKGRGLAERSVETQPAIMAVGYSNKVTGTTMALSQIMQGTMEPFLRYAMFSFDDLDLSPAYGMTVEGPVHANGDIFLNASPKAGEYLSFNDTLTASGGIFIDQKGTKATLEEREWEAQQTLIVDADGVSRSFFDGSIIDHNHSGDEWVNKSVDRWMRQVMDKAHGVQEKAVPGDTSGTNSHVIVCLPRPGVEPLRKSVYFSERVQVPGDRGVYVKVKSDGLVEITHNGASAKDYVPLRGKVPKVVSGEGLYDPTPVYAAELPLVTGPDPLVDFVGIHHSRLYDPRQHPNTFNGETAELQNMAVVDVYMDRLLAYSGFYGNADLMYIEVEDPDVSGGWAEGTGAKPVVRLRNGQDLSDAVNGGLSIATHRGLYLEGDFNVINPENYSTMVMADNLTVLSVNWEDYDATSPYNLADTNNIAPGKRPNAKDTYINTAILSGDISVEARKVLKELAGTWRISGAGAQNLIRFSEHWGDGNKKFRYKGSYCLLWDARESNHTIGYGWYFKAPERFVTFDEQFLDIDPPGVPKVLSETPRARKELTWDEALALQELHN
ncbi:MAG TPA: hypothetical protein VIR63_00945 [Pontiella sp.]